MKVINNHKEIAKECLKDCLVVDIETSSEYDIKEFDNYVRTAVVKWIGFYSYTSGRYYEIDCMKTSKLKIQEFFNAHKTLVSFNGIEFDIPVLKNNGMLPERYFSQVDCNVILGNNLIRGHKNRGMLMGYKFPNNKLSTMAKVMKLETMKGSISYDVFKKNEWNEEETKDIRKYLRGDVEVTKQMFDKLYSFWEPFTEFISEKNVKQWNWLRSSSGSLSYKVLCNYSKLPEEYGEYTETKEEMGGLVLLPSGAEYKDVWYMDFACLPTGTKIRRQREDKKKPGNRGNKYDTNIEDIKSGDIICGENFVNTKVSNVQSKDYDGELYEFELENGKVLSCTPEHKFPIIRNRKRIVAEAKDILETDEFISTFSKFENINPNYIYGREVRMCTICGTEFEIDSRMKQKTCGNEECVNTSRSIHGKIHGCNIGKNKYNCKHLKRLSDERTDVPRKEEHKQNISIGTKNAIKLIPQYEKMRWMQKHMRSQKYNTDTGRFVYNDINFKSNWEIITAKYLDKANIKWRYEPTGFLLSDGKYYYPDFYLPEYDKWVEVKGYMYDRGREKIKKFTEEHKDLYLLNTLDKIKNISKESVKKW